jgi:hypothetical protein
MALLPMAIAPVVFSEAVSAVPKNPHFFCFAKGSYDEVINLNHLCQQTPALPPKDVAKPTPPRINPSPQSPKKLIEIKTDARAKVDFLELNYEKGLLIGSVRNKSKIRMDRVWITYKVYERQGHANWKLVDTGSTRTADNSIAPGKTSPFKALTLVNGDKVVITNVQ